MSRSSAERVKCVRRNGELTTQCPACSREVGLEQSNLIDVLICAACLLRFKVYFEGPVDTIGMGGWKSRTCVTTVIAGCGPAVTEKFSVLGVLGRGSQGAIYRVRPWGGAGTFALRYLDARVKVPALAIDRPHEVRALTHPNIVTLLGLGIDRDPRSGLKRPYALYELVEGETLATRLKRGALPLDDALDVAYQILAGLSHSHRLGIVHRDLKPANVILTENGLAKIQDFGIGRSIGRELTLPPAAGEGFIGTPAYAAPEQIEGTAIMRATDVYAFGVMFYEMVTGRKPFNAATIERMFYHQLYGLPVAPEVHRPGLAPALNRLILRCLSKAPAHRPTCAQEVLDLLKQAARATRLPEPLELEPHPAAPASISSGERLARVGPRLLVSALVMGLPLSLGILLASHARLVHWPPLLTATVLLLAFLWRMVGPVAWRWIALSLSPTAPTIAEPLASVEIQGSSDYRISWDGITPARSPSRLLLEPGRHDLTVDAPGRSQKVFINVTRASRYRCKIEPGDDGTLIAPVPAVDPEQVPEDGQTQHFFIGLLLASSVLVGAVTGLWLTHLSTVESPQRTEAACVTLAGLSN